MQVLPYATSSDRSGTFLSNAQYCMCIAQKCSAGNIEDGGAGTSKIHINIQTTVAYGIKQEKKKLCYTVDQASK